MITIRNAQFSGEPHYIYPSMDVENCSFANCIVRVMAHMPAGSIRNCTFTNCKIKDDSMPGTFQNCTFDPPLYTENPKFDIGHQPPGVD